MTNRLSTENFAKLIIIFFLGALVHGNEICKIILDCPGNYNGDTVRVGSNVVALSEVFNHCAPDSIVEAPIIDIKDTVSVFFVIDHSSSMSHMDSTAMRYQVVADLIDTIAAKSPQSEIGLAVFSNQLLHSYKEDPFYVQLDQDNPDWHDSYIPLTRLDAENSIEKLKKSIEISSAAGDIDAGGNFRLVNGNYDPTGRRDSRLFEQGINHNGGYNGGTDITLGFEAARQAFQTASNPREKQFIVFLSDGVHQSVDVERGEFQTDYLAGINIPTTFTAFFININQPIPEQIVTMTENIKSNGYSETNEKSEVWKNLGSVSELSSRLLNILNFGEGTQVFTSTPVSITINGITTENFDNTNAVFDRMIPLTGVSTSLEISYTWHWNEPVNKNSTADYKVVIQQSPNPDPALQTICWPQGNLKFYYEGDELRSVEEQHTSIQIRYYPPEGMWPQTGIDLIIKNGSNTDSLVLQTGNQDDYFYSSFTREFGTPIPDDNILQNEPNGKIIAVYRNPELPLDTVIHEISVGEPEIIGVETAYYLDTNANGYPDIIRITQDEDSRLTNEQISFLKDYINFTQTERNLSISKLVSTEQGFDIILDESSQKIAFTGLFPEERLYIDRVSFSEGGEMPAVNITIGDSMAPVIEAAAYYGSVNTHIMDTLVVTFTENVNSNFHEQPFLLRKGNNTEDYSLRLSVEKINEKTVTFSVIPVTNQEKPSQDSININTIASVGDKSRNIQLNPENKRSKLDYYLLYSIGTVAYFDDNGDGLIDIVRFSIDSTPTQALLDQLYSTVKLPSYRNFSYDLEDFSAIQNGFEIKVKQPKGTKPYTAVDSRDTVSIVYTEATDGSVVNPSTLQIIDSVAPVLINVIYIPGIIDSSSESIFKDSLIVRYSEPVDPPSSNQPFRFFDPKTGKEYSMQLKFVSRISPDEQIFDVIDIIDKNYPSTTDSVSINPAAQVSDTANNVQDSENKKVPLNIRPPKNDYRITSLNNPSDPQTAVIPPSVRNYYGIKETKGILIIAEPVLNLAGNADISGKLKIYDATGNLVFFKKYNSAKSMGKTSTAAFVWNGKNRNGKGRDVGTGTYLAVISLDDKIKKHLVQHKIGIMRSTSSNDE